MYQSTMHVPLLLAGVALLRETVSRTPGALASLRPALDRHVQTNEVRRSAALLGGFLTVAAETGLLMASPSETTLIVLGAAGVVGILETDTVAFWSAATAIGLTITMDILASGPLTGAAMNPA